MKCLCSFIAVFYILNSHCVKAVEGEPSFLNVFLSGSNPPYKEHVSRISNISYTIPAAQSNDTMVDSSTWWMELSCVGEKPTRWVIWKPEAEQLEFQMDSLIRIEKERKWVHNQLHYFSNLRFNFTESSKEGSGINFSCLYEKDWLRGRFTNEFKNLTGIGVEVRPSFFDDDLTLKETVVNVLNNKAFNIYYRATESHFLSCPNNLTVELNNGRGGSVAKCDSKGVTLSSDKCSDIDTCDSLAIIYMTKQTKNCRGNFAKLGSSTSFLTIPHRRLPIVIYCKNHRNDQTWTAFQIVYPSFGGINQSLLYHSSIKEALNSSSIRIMTKNNTLIFAENEIVEFTCIAVKYLFQLQGFQWLIGDTVVYYDSRHETYETKDNLLVVKRNIKLTSKTISWISCQGPVWNSEDLMTSTINITVFASSPPNGELLHNIVDGGHDNFTCKYWGWPRPTVTWIFSENVTTLPPNLIVENFDHAPNITWSEIHVIPSRSKVYTVTCKLENLNGTIALNSKNIVKDSKIIYIVVTILSLVLCLASVFMYWRYRKKLGEQQELTSEEINEFYSGVANNSTTYEALYLPYNPEYEIDREQLKLDGSILGSGQFGLVLKGTIGNVPVAVKTVKPISDLIYIKSLLAELKILQFVGTHPSIVNLIGANTSNIKKREVFLILDYCSNGNLVNFLRQSRDRFVNFFGNSSPTEKSSRPLYENRMEITLTTGNLIMFACEIASAMDHLSSKNVIHGDLAARNVLVTEDFHAKVCDFGLAKQLLHYSVYVQKIDCPLPLRWMAIESLQDMEFSLASDKWSYGICLWEVFSLAELPYPGVQWSFESYKMLQEGYRMEKPQFANDSILMLQCWNAQPLERPNFQYIINELKKEEDMLT